MTEKRNALLSMTFTRYKLIIGGENDFSFFFSMRIFQFFTNLKEEDFFFIQNLAWFTNHSKHFDSGIHVGSYKTIAFRNPFTKWDLVYLPKLTKRSQEKVVYLFFQNTKTGTKFIGLRTYVLQMAISAVFSPCFQLWGLAQFVKLSTAT